MAPGNVEKLLASIRARIGRLPADRAPSLRAAANDTARAMLASTFAMDQLPSDLDEWFRSHDGQDPLDQGIDPDAPAITWLSIDDALAAWRFLGDENEEILQPWSKDWLPIAQNGGGDYLVYELAGAKPGTLRSYYHDDEARPIEAKSLETFVRGVDRRLASVAKSLKQKKSAPTMVDDSEATWANADAPSAEVLADAPVGTAFHVRALPYQSYWYRVFVKVGKGAWIVGKGQNPPPICDDDYRVGAALDDIANRLAEKLPREWKMKEADVVAALADEKVFPEGLYALKGKPAKGNAYFIRRRAQLAVR